MMCRGILSSLTEACTLQAHASEMLHRQRPPTSTDETSWIHISWRMYRGNPVETNQKFKKIWPKLDYHMNLCKLLLGAC